MRAASQAWGVMVISARPAWTAEKMRLAACGDGGRDEGGVGAEVEPRVFLVALAGEVGMVLAAGTHEAGADGGDADAFVAELGVEAFGEAGEGELGGDVGEQVRDGDLAADGGDVDDSAMSGLAGEGRRAGAGVAAWMV